MQMLKHFLYMLGFIIVSAAISIALPRFMADLDPLMAMGFGAVTLVLQVSIYFLVYSRNAHQSLNAKIEKMDDDFVNLATSVNYLVEEFKKVTAKTASRSGKNRELVNEVRMLQSLISTSADEKPAAPAPKKAVKTAKGKAAKSTKASEKAPAPAAPKVVEIKQDLSDEQIYEAIYSAFKENRIDLYLQPVVALPSRRPVHYECFSRVRDVHGDIISAKDYMGIAQESGLSGTLDNLVLFRAMQVIRRLGPRRPEVRFFCNISTSSLNDREFFPQFIDFMLSNADLANRLIFEFSQVDVDNMSDNVEQSLMALGQRGFRFSMDQTTNLNFDIEGLAERYFIFVKVDVEELLKGEGPTNPEIIKSELAQYKMELVAAKIETEKSVLKVLDHDLDYGQGFLFGEPRPSRDNQDDDAAAVAEGKLQRVG
jgi:cyclic-di-GMP phosphodiesterase TipF (flagellum assembly factor)